MKSTKWTIGAAALWLLYLSAGKTAAQTPVRVFASNGVKAVIEQLRAQCERAAGRMLNIQFDSTAGLRQKVNSGQAFDVAILTTTAIDDLIKEGKLAASSRANVARAGIGIGVKSGVPKPDIGTSETLKQTLLNSKSITF